MSRNRSTKSSRNAFIGIGVSAAGGGGLRISATVERRSVADRLVQPVTVENRLAPSVPLGRWTALT